MPHMIVFGKRYLLHNMCLSKTPFIIYNYQLPTKTHNITLYKQVSVRLHESMFRAIPLKQRWLPGYEDKLGEKLLNRSGIRQNVDYNRSGSE